MVIKLVAPTWGYWIYLAFFIWAFTYIVAKFMKEITDELKMDKKRKEIQKKLNSAFNDKNRNKY